MIFSNLKRWPTGNNSNAMYSRFFKFLVFVFVTCDCFSQSTITSPYIDVFEHAPAAPNSAGLGKFLDYPVNMSSGLPNIEIPIYTIKSGNITLPISIKYHSGGLRVDESASWVGMGWSLDAGGSINKRVNGVDDFYPVDNNGYYSTYLNPILTPYTSYFTNMSDAIESPGLNTYINNHAIDLEHFLGRIPQGKIDGEADEFLFSTPEAGGKFFYNQQLHQFQLDKINGWKITGTPSFDQFISGQIVGEGTWDIMNNAGVKYSFGRTEQYENPMIITPQLNPDPLGVPPAPTLVNAWYLSQISDLSNHKEISITYDEKSLTSYPGFSMSREYSLGGHYLQSHNAQDNIRVGKELSISAIYFDQGSVIFIKDPNPRLDGGTNALKEIQIRDINDKIIKKYLFTYSYVTSDPLTNNYTSVPGLTLQNPNTVIQQLFLQSVQEVSIDANGVTISNPPYTFIYNTDHQMPCRLSFAQDYWGYYNGKSGNTTLLSNEDYITYGLTDLDVGANRDIDQSFTQTGIIKELHYPTGGKAVFEFENNETAPGQLTGGLRIKRISNYDNVNNISLVNEYSYGSGEQLFKPVTSYKYFYNTGAPTTTWEVLKMEGQPIYPLFCSQGSPVLYLEVTQKQTSNSTELISKHHFLNMGLLDNYQNDPGQAGGVPHNKYEYYDNFNGQEYASELFRKNTDGTTTMVQSNSTDLEPLNDLKNYFWNIQVGWAERTSSLWSIYPGLDPYSGGEDQPLYFDVDINAYKMLQDQAVAKQKQQITYEGSHSINTQSFFDYDVTNGNNKVVKTINSKGDELTKVTKFATDYGDFGTGGDAWNAGLSALKDANMVGVPIEVVNYIKKKDQTNLLLLDATLFQYENLSVKKIYKLNTSVPISDFQESYNTSAGFFHDSRYELFQEVTARDANNSPLTVKQYSNKESYIWDYSNTNIIAIIKEADHADVAYTSFESDGTGNWSFSGSSTHDPTSPTGSKSYNLSTGNITKLNLTSGYTYIVSYWSKTGNPYFVNGSNSPAKTGQTINGWTYYEHEVTAADITISGTGNIDELRLYPKGALMTTYTFNPLVGISSQCDVNNRINYYEYDALQRLSIIRDQNKNVVKKFCYNYAGQVENCNTLYGNVELSGTFTRNNCPADYSGSEYVYTIEPGRYTSGISEDAANQQAQADIDANGQNLANTYGTCVRDFVYAKVSIENQVGNQGDVVVNFFEDALCTIPYSVTNLNVSIQEEDYNDLSGSSTYTTSIKNCTGSNVVVFPSVLLIEPLYDQYQTNIYRYFTLNQGDGYIPTF